MRIVYTIISLTLFSVFFYFGHYRPIASLPPLVKFFNPYSGFWEQAEGQKLPRRYFEAEVNGDITISFDERWVPHIYAETYADAVYAQGILHAYFRLWQMDITQRGALGKVSEILGERALEHDKARRRIGMMTAAERITSNLQEFPQTQAYVQSYLDGANTIINNLSPADYPLEFKLLNYKPQEWTELHLSGVIMAMIYDLCYKHNDVESSMNFHLFSDSLYRHYFPLWNPKQVPVVQKDREAYLDAKPFTAPVVNPSDIFIPGDMPEEGLGSNSWAIHASKTKNGSNILANDPHLGLNLPSIWYELHIHLPEKDIYGVSIPGIPGIVLGFNDDYAWGSTNVGHDVADWYRLIWKDSSFTEYFYEGEWLMAEQGFENIAVKDGDTLSLPVYETKTGRVPFLEKGHPLAGCAFQWGPVTALEGHPLNAFVGFNLGEDYEDFEDALTNHEFAAQNFVFADKVKNIAMHVQGKLPVRKNGYGEFILDSIDSAQWLQLIPQLDLPYEHNPPRNYVSSANQHSTYPTYQYQYHGVFDDFRGRTLDSFLRHRQNIDVAKSKEYQLSTFSLEAREALPVLLSYIRTGDEKIRNAIDMLADWDCNFDAGSQPAVIFDLWWQEVLEQTNDEFDTSSAFIENWRVLSLLKTDQKDSIFDKQKTTTLIEDGQMIVQKGLEKALESYHQQNEPSWSQYKRTVIRHIAQIEAFSSGIIDNGGTKHSLNAMQRTKGPSWRMIVELKDPIQAQGVYPGGQSGNPGSAFYDNQIEDWAKGHYYPLLLIQEPNDARFIRQWTIKKKK